jgi:hypothetical protein
MKALIQLVILTAGAGGSAVWAQSGEILFCDPQHPNYANCQRQLGQQRDLEATKQQNIFKGLDPFKSKCNSASPSYNECERQRIVAVRNYKLPRSSSLAMVVPIATVRCDPQKQLYAECEVERQRYKREVDAIRGAARELNRQAQDRAAVRQGTREGVRDAIRGY